jgi:hypothetical protein
MVQGQRVAALMLSSLFFLAPVVYVFFVVSPWHPHRSSHGHHHVDRVGRNVERSQQRTASQR